MYGVTDQVTEPLTLVEESPEPEVGTTEEVSIPAWAVLLILVLVVVPVGTLWFFGGDKPAQTPAADPMTNVTYTYEGSTTITQVMPTPRSEASRSAGEKQAAVVVLTTEASKAPASASSTTTTTLPTVASVSEDTSAPATTTTKLPTMAPTSTSSEPTSTSAATPAASASVTP